MSCLVHLHRMAQLELVACLMDISIVQNADTERFVGCENGTYLVLVSIFMKTSIVADYPIPSKYWWYVWYIRVFLKEIG